MTKRPIVSRDSLDLLSNHFLRRKPAYPLGASFGELDYLRGWKDDFFGDSLHEQYTSQTVGVGSQIILIDASHGGAVRIRGGNANGRYARLWLGDAAGGYDTIRPDNGAVIIAQMRLTSVTNCDIQFGVEDVVGGDYIRLGLRTPVGNDWRIWCNDGVASNTGSALVADTDPHLHIAEISNNLVRYWMDGDLIVTHTANVPNATYCTPFVWAYSRAVAYKAAVLDLWNVVPRNL